MRIEIDSMPTELDEVERRLKQLEIERQALKKENDPVSKKRLSVVESEIANLSETSRELRLHWEMEKSVISAIRAIK